MGAIPGVADDAGAGEAAGDAGTLSDTGGDDTGADAGPLGAVGAAEADDADAGLA